MSLNKLLHLSALSVESGDGLVQTVAKVFSRSGTLGVGVRSGTCMHAQSCRALCDYNSWIITRQAPQSLGFSCKLLIQACRPGNQEGIREGLGLLWLCLLPATHQHLPRVGAWGTTTQLPRPGVRNQGGSSRNSTGGICLSPGRGVISRICSSQRSLNWFILIVVVESLSHV